MGYGLMPDWHQAVVYIYDDYIDKHPMKLATCV